MKKEKWEIANKIIKYAKEIDERQQNNYSDEKLLEKCSIIVDCICNECHNFKGMKNETSQYKFDPDRIIKSYTRGGVDIQCRENKTELSKIIDDIENATDNLLDCQLEQLEGKDFYNKVNKYLLRIEGLCYIARHQITDDKRYQESQNIVKEKSPEVINV